MEGLQELIVEALALVATGCLTVATRAFMGYLKKKGVIANLQSHKELANIAVNAIEQTYKELHGEEKLNLAKIEFIKTAQAKGLKISEQDIDLFIESAVKEMNKVVKEELKK